MAHKRLFVRTLMYVWVGGGFLNSSIIFSKTGEFFKIN